MLFTLATISLILSLLSALCVWGACKKDYFGSGVLGVIFIGGGISLVLLVLALVFGLLSLL